MQTVIIDLPEEYVESRVQAWFRAKDKKYVTCPFCGKELAGTDLNFCCKCGKDLRMKVMTDNGM